MFSQTKNESQAAREIASDQDEFEFFDAQTGQKGFFLKEPNGAAAGVT